MAQGRKRQKGEMNVAGTKKWNGTKWVPVNVARDGQRATRNGKPVVRRNGVWVPYKTSTRSRSRSSASKPRASTTSSRTTSSRTTSPRAKDGSYTVLGVDYDSVSHKAWSPKDENGRQHTARHGYSIDPKTGERTNTSRATASQQAASSQRQSSPSSSRSSATSSSRSTSSSRARTPQSSDMDANYRAWAKANPELAKKVRKGQAGYDAINGTSSSSSTSGVGPVKDGDAYAESIEGSRRSANRSADWLRDNFRPDGTASQRAASDARSGVRRGIRAGAQTDRNIQAGKKYDTGNKFSDFDGGANPQRGSQKDFAPKRPSLKDALRSITSKWDEKKRKHRTDGYF